MNVILFKLMNEPNRGFILFHTLSIKNGLKVNVLFICMENRKRGMAALIGLNSSSQEVIADFSQVINQTCSSNLVQTSIVHFR